MNCSEDSPTPTSSAISSNNASRCSRSIGDTPACKHKQFMIGFELTRQFTNEKNGMIRRFRDEEALLLSRIQSAQEALLGVKEKTQQVLSETEDLQQLFHALAGVMGIVKEALEVPACSPPRGGDR